MKQVGIKITISILTFAVGVSAFAIWLVKFKPDLNVYSVEFNTLIQESENYDGKIVQVKASYVQGYEASFLTDFNHSNFITAKCRLDKESCEHLFDLLKESLESQEEITVIGRYCDSEYQDYDGYVHTIEILEVKPTNTPQP